jgi:hypothetical protein
MRMDDPEAPARLQLTDAEAAALNALPRKRERAFVLGVVVRYRRGSEVPNAALAAVALAGYRRRGFAARLATAERLLNLPRIREVLRAFGVTYESRADDTKAAHALP